MAIRVAGKFGSPHLGNGRVGVSVGQDRISAPWIEIVTNKSTGNIEGQIRPPGTFGLANGQGRFRVSWWDGTQTETTVAVNLNSQWSKAAGAEGTKVIRFYPITQGGAIAKGDIQRFIATEMGISSVSIRGISGLKVLQLNRNLVDRIDLNGCDDLDALDLTENELTSIDVSGQKKIRELFVPKNAITALNVSGLTLMTFLSCYDNPITELDVSDQPVIANIDTRDCEMDADALNALYESLPDRTGLSAGTVATGGNPGYEDEDEDQSIATDKNWAVTAVKIE